MKGMTSIEHTRMGATCCWVLLVCLFSFPVSASEEPVGQPGEEGGLEQDATSKSGAECPPTAQPSPMMRQIQDVLDMQQTTVAQLEDRFQAVTDEATALAIQREIRAILIQTELDILRIQADFARREGRDAVVRAIEISIERMISPPPPQAPTDRPAPEPQPR